MATYHRQSTANSSILSHDQPAAAMASPEELKSEVRRIIPPLADDRFKGQSGKIATFGGCFEYTSPAYFCGIACLKVGADLSHVFCTKAAAPIIKGYTPEVMVHPYFKESSELTAEELTDERRATMVLEGAAEVEAWFSRLDCLVVGPGLGRDPLLLDIARLVIQRAKEAALPLVLDGDALVLVAREPQLVHGYTQCILTPNLNEFRRLASTMGVSMHGPNNDRIKKLHEVTRHLQGPVVVSKGPVDVITDGHCSVVCATNSGARRCTGQGDILAGCIATYVAWTLSFLENATKNGEVQVLPEINPIILGAFGGCMITRTAAAAAFQHKRRSMLAGDMVEHLGTAVEFLFDVGTAAGGASAAGLLPGDTPMTRGT